jgi:hypothetical protein
MSERHPGLRKVVKGRTNLTSYFGTRVFPTSHSSIRPLLILNVRWINKLRKELSFENYAAHLKVFEPGKDSFLFVSHKWFSTSSGDSPDNQLQQWILANIPLNECIWIDLCCIPSEVDLEIKEEFIASIPNYIHSCKSMVVLTFDQERLRISAWCYLESLLGLGKLEKAVDLSTGETFTIDEELRIVRVGRKNDYVVVMAALMRHLKKRHVSSVALQQWIESCDMINGVSYKSLKQSHDSPSFAKRQYRSLLVMVLFVLITTLGLSIALPLSLSAANRSNIETLITSAPTNAQTPTPTTNMPTDAPTIPQLEVEQIDYDYDTLGNSQSLINVNGEIFIDTQAGKCKVIYSPFIGQRTIGGCHSIVYENLVGGSNDWQIIYRVQLNTGHTWVGSYPFTYEDDLGVLLDGFVVVYGDGTGNLPWLGMVNLTHESIVFPNRSVVVLDHSNLPTCTSTLHRFIRVHSLTQAILFHCGQVRLLDLVSKSDQLVMTDPLAQAMIYFREAKVILLVRNILQVYGLLFQLNSFCAHQKIWKMFSLLEKCKTQGIWFMYYVLAQQYITEENVHIHTYIRYLYHISLYITSTY